MEEKSGLDLNTISKRAVKGAFSLTFRRVALQAIGFITINLILARVLPVSTLGVFNIAAAIIAFFSFFSDIGFSAAIIQKKGEVKEDDLKTTFTIQLGLVFAIVAVIFFGAPFFASSYGLPEGGVFLIQALSLSFLITSLKVIPSVLLERELNFNPLVGVEVLETFVFNVSLIVLVFSGFDLNSFSFAAIARSILGTGAIYIIAPWKLRLGFSRESAKALLNFGIPFQMNSLLALLKDRLVPLVIARIVGAEGIGYITWSQNLAFLPLEVMNIIIRVSFPTLSRLQEDSRVLKDALEKSIFITTFFVYPMLCGMLALAPFLVEHVVSSKWAPALPSFYLFSVSTFWATLSTTFTNALNAIGEIKVTLKLMIFWTVITWILTPILSIYFGFIGVALSSAIISFTSVVTIIIIKRFINVSIIGNIWQSLVSSALMGVIVFFLSKVFVRDLPTLLIMVVVGAVIYTGFVSLLAKDKLHILFKGAKNALSAN